MAANKDVSFRRPTYLSADPLQQRVEKQQKEANKDDPEHDEQDDVQLEEVCSMHQKQFVRI